MRSGDHVQLHGEQDDSLAVTVAEAAALLHIGRSLAWESVRNGTIPSVRISRRVLVPRAALVELLQSKNNDRQEGVP